jgi:hypothetical protein
VIGLAQVADRAADKAGARDPRAVGQLGGEDLYQGHDHAGNAGGHGTDAKTLHDDGAGAGCGTRGQHRDRRCQCRPGGKGQ